MSRWDHKIFKTKLNAGLALRQRADLLKANISANKISLPQDQSYTERKKKTFLLDEMRENILSQKAG